MLPAREENHDQLHFGLTPTFLDFIEGMFDIVVLGVADKNADLCGRWRGS
jgi:hypothetical protein